MIECYVQHCNRPSRSLGLCNRHYLKNYRYGDPTHGETRNTSPDPEDRLTGIGWRVVGDCWLWLGSKHKGYGQLTINDKLVRAHRVAYEVWVGPLAGPEEVVRHTCDTPSCINPEHLVRGTQADNVQDMWDRGRANPYNNRHRSN